MKKLLFAFCTGLISLSTALAKTMPTEEINAINMAIKQILEGPIGLPITATLSDIEINDADLISRLKLNLQYISREEREKTQTMNLEVSLKDQNIDFQLDIQTDDFIQITDFMVSLKQLEESVNAEGYYKMAFSGSEVEGKSAEFTLTINSKSNDKTLGIKSGYFHYTSDYVTGKQDFTAKFSLNTSHDLVARGQKLVNSFLSKIRKGEAIDEADHEEYTNFVSELAALALSTVTLNPTELEGRDS